MDDFQRLQEHALARQRLLGSYLRGSEWRQRTDPNPFRRVVAGMILACVACLAVAAASFASNELAKQKALRAAAMAPRTCAPPTVDPAAPGTRSVRSMSPSAQSTATN